MATYNEERVTLPSGKQIVVCIPENKYSEFFRGMIEYNVGRQYPSKIESLRPLVKRLTKGAISYEEFVNSYM